MSVDTSSLRSALVDFATQTFTDAQDALLAECVISANTLNPSSGEGTPMADTGHTDLIGANEAAVVGSIGFDSDHASFTDEGRGPVFANPQGPMLHFFIAGVEFFRWSVGPYEGSNWFTSVAEDDATWERVLSDAANSVSVVA